VKSSDNLIEEVKKQISSDKIVLFMKGVPLAPECGFSRAVCQVLSFYGFKYTSYNINVAGSGPYKEAIKQVSSWPTFPQLYVNGELIGGCDIVVNMHREGQLKDVLEKSGAELVKKE
jgi:monothiol glutaredoxin